LKTNAELTLPVLGRQGHKNRNTNTNVKINKRQNRLLNKNQRVTMCLKRNIPFPMPLISPIINLVSKASNFKMWVIVKLQANVDYINISSIAKKACKQRQHLLHFRSKA
jgi:hypothetical protein